MKTYVDLMLTLKRIEILTATLFVIMKNWKQSKCLSAVKDNSNSDLIPKIILSATVTLYRKGDLNAYYTVWLH